MALTDAGAPEASDKWGPATSRLEWEYMYLRGMTLMQIARHCRVDYPQVRAHIYGRFRNDPTSLGRRLVLHNQPAPAPPGWREVKDRQQFWEARFEQLQLFLNERGHYPRKLSPDPDERKLFGRLNQQRAQDKKDQLPADRLQRLHTATPDWRGKTLGSRDEYFARRLKELQ